MDGLFGRFMHDHRDYFEQNRRMKMLLPTLDRMNGDKRKAHFQHAQTFLDQL